MTSKNAFKTEDICAIIKVCSQSGVREFKYLNLSFSFGHVYAPTTEPIFIPEPIAHQADTQTRETLSKNENDMKQEQLDMMLLEDPEGFEELLRIGDLKDERT
jgi:hypothetical protein